MHTIKLITIIVCTSLTLAQLVRDFNTISSGVTTIAQALQRQPNLLTNKTPFVNTADQQRTASVQNVQNFQSPLINLASNNSNGKMVIASGNDWVSSSMPLINDIAKDKIQAPISTNVNDGSSLIKDIGNLKREDIDKMSINQLKALMEKLEKEKMILTENSNFNVNSTRNQNNQTLTGNTPSVNINDKPMTNESMSQPITVNLAPAKNTDNSKGNNTGNGLGDNKQPTLPGIPNAPNTKLDLFGNPQAVTKSSSNSGSQLLDAISGGIVGMSADMLAGMTPEQAQNLLASLQSKQQNNDNNVQSSNQGVNPSISMSHNNVGNSQQQFQGQLSTNANKQSVIGVGSNSNSTSNAIDAATLEKVRAALMNEQTLAEIIKNNPGILSIINTPSASPSMQSPSNPPMSNNNSISNPTPPAINQINVNPQFPGQNPQMFNPNSNSNLTNNSTFDIGKAQINNANGGFSFGQDTTMNTQAANANFSFPQTTSLNNQINRSNDPSVNGFSGFTPGQLNPFYQQTSPTNMINPFNPNSPPIPDINQSQSSPMSNPLNPQTTNRFPNFPNNAPITPNTTPNQTLNQQSSNGFQTQNQFPQSLNTGSLNGFPISNQTPFNVAPNAINGLMNQPVLGYNSATQPGVPNSNLNQNLNGLNSTQSLNDPFAAFNNGGFPQGTVPQPNAYGTSTPTDTKMAKITETDIQNLSDSQLKLLAERLNSLNPKPPVTPPGQDVNKLSLVLPTSSPTINNPWGPTSNTNTDQELTNLMKTQGLLQNEISRQDQITKISKTPNNVPQLNTQLLVQLTDLIRKKGADIAQITNVQELQTFLTEETNHSKAVSSTNNKAPNNTIEREESEILDKLRNNQIILNELMNIFKEQAKTVPNNVKSNNQNNPQNPSNQNNNSLIPSNPSPRGNNNQISSSSGRFNSMDNQLQNNNNLDYMNNNQYQDNPFQSSTSRNRSPPQNSRNNPSINNQRGDSSQFNNQQLNQSNNTNDYNQNDAYFNNEYNPNTQNMRSNNQNSNTNGLYNKKSRPPYNQQPNQQSNPQFTYNSNPPNDFGTNTYNNDNYQDFSSNSFNQSPNQNNYYQPDNTRFDPNNQSFSNSSNQNTFERNNQAPNNQQSIARGSVITANQSRNNAVVQLNNDPGQSFMGMSQNMPRGNQTIQSFNNGPDNQFSYNGPYSNIDSNMDIGPHGTTLNSPSGAGNGMKLNPDGSPFIEFSRPSPKQPSQNTNNSVPWLKGTQKTNMDINDDVFGSAMNTGFF